MKTYLIAASLLVPLLACGSPNKPSANELTSGTMAIAAGDFLVASLSLDTRAPLQTQVDWSVIANDLDAFLIRGTCSRDDIISAKPACTMDAVFVGSGTGTTKPETFTTAAVDPGAYTLLVVNRGSQDDTCSFRVTAAN